MPFSLSDAFAAPPPPVLTNGCSGAAAGVAGMGMPAASTVIGDASAAAKCPSELAAGNFFSSEAMTNAYLIYKIKGPGAVATTSDVSLFARLHGTISGSSALGVFNNATNRVEVSMGAAGNSRLDGTNSVGGEAILLVDSVNGVTLSGDLSSDLVNQSTASTAIYALDHTFETDFSVSGWLATLDLTLDCQAKTTEPAGLVIPPQSAACNFDLGDTSAYLQSNAPSVILERVAPIHPTTPRSAVYLSPASAPIEIFPGSPGIPSTVTGAGDLGQGATGGGDATGDVSAVASELAVTTGASSHVDQSATTADANATVVSEGQGAASLRYHVTLLNGFNNLLIPFQVSYPTLNATVSATQGLDSSVLQRSSLELSVSVQGVQLFHFLTLSLGSSNEDPPGLSGDLASTCVDQSTAMTQACAITNGAFVSDAGAAVPDRDGDLVLTVQSDCTTSVSHPSGAIQPAHPLCDASHTIAAKLVSGDPTDVVLTPVPEPGAAAAAAAALCGLATRLVPRVDAGSVNKKTGGLRIAASPLGRRHVDR